MSSQSMSYKGYKASMVFDTVDKLIIGRVLDIDDIITFHAESVSEFETRLHAAIDDYLAACAALGSAPEKPASGKLMLRIAPAVHAAALRAAELSGTSLNKWAEATLGKAASRVGKRANSEAESSAAK
jgi:predicted HicB family RNase H-like nuclease